MLIKSYEIWSILQFLLIIYRGKQSVPTPVLITDPVKPTENNWQLIKNTSSQEPTAITHFPHKQFQWCHFQDQHCSLRKHQLLDWNTGQRHLSWLCAGPHSAVKRVHRSLVPSCKLDTGANSHSCIYLEMVTANNTEKYNFAVIK